MYVQTGCEAVFGATACKNKRKTFGGYFISSFNIDRCKSFNLTRFRQKL